MCMMCEFFEVGECLWVVGCVGIGVDNIDVEVVIECGILVVNVLIVNLMLVIEYIFVLLLVLMCNVFVVDCLMKVEQWDCKSFLGLELYGKMFGFIGCGQIGQCVVS